MKSILRYSITITLISLFFIACKKDKFSSISAITFSNDTLKFDTVFTTLGSTTKFFTIKNNESKSITIDEIKISGSSNFRINVDGDTGTIFKNISIPAKDSIYVFVEVTINPNATNLPFVLFDSVSIKSEQKLQRVILQAYGQNAHFFDGDTIQTNTLWTNDLPYVILNTLSIGKTAKLTIDAGCKVYFGGGAALLVEGELNIQGNNDTTDAVLFRTYRLDKDIYGNAYENFPGLWAGLFFLRESKGNINNLILRNSLYGINVGNITTTDDAAGNLTKLQNAKLNNGAILEIKNSKIYNNLFYNIFGFLSTIQAENVLCYSANTNCVGLYYGGNYSFINCTFYNQSNQYISHSKTPTLAFNNYLEVDQTTTLHADSSKLEMRNSIIYGSLDEEILLDELNDNPNKLYFQFKYCNIKNKSGNLLTKPTFVNCINSDPKFENTTKFNFELKDDSPCINAGDDIEYFPITDLKGNSRIGKPDLGVYEKQ